MKRHIANNTSDYVKQQQIDICHGIFSRVKPYIYDNGYDRIEKPDAKTKPFSSRDWVVEAEKEYFLKILKQNMVRVEDAMLETLRDDFMKTSIPTKHLSLKEVDIIWGTPLEYKTQV